MWDCKVCSFTPNSFMTCERCGRLEDGEFPVFVSPDRIDKLEQRIHDLELMAGLTKNPVVTTMENGVITKTVKL